MKRIVNRQKKRVEYEFPEAEFRQKLGIPEEMAGGFYYSTVRHVVRFTCFLPEDKR